MSGVENVLEGRSRDLDGFSVRRVLPSGRRQTVGPFIFFDHMGPAVFAAGKGIDVRPHPHIGLATVTYLFEGAFLHRDSLGTAQLIEPGDVNWMVAGRGIVHSERTPAASRAIAGESAHGIQAWIALPAADEETAPSFAHHPASSLPTIHGSGATLRLIAGEAFGARAPASVFSPLFYLDARLEPGATVCLPQEYAERAVYVVEGRIDVDGSCFGAGQMVIFSTGAAVTLSAVLSARLMLLGGEPLEGRRHIWWNFVSSRPERIERAKLDWRDKRFADVPGDSERTPLPES